MIARVANRVLASFGVCLVETAALRQLMDSPAQERARCAELELRMAEAHAREEGLKGHVERLEAQYHEVARELVYTHRRLAEQDRVIELSKKRVYGTTRLYQLDRELALADVLQRLSESHQGGQQLMDQLASRIGNVEHVMRSIEADRNLTQLIVGHPFNDLHSRILRVARLMAPHMVIGHNKLRLGRHNDGGYVLLDDFRNIASAFSFGIDRDASWDFAVAERGIVVHQFDFSVAAPPISHQNFRFERKRIVSTRDEDGVTLGSLLEQYGKGDAASIILKIDIESDEWDVFAEATLEELRQFSQIVCEFHGFHLVGKDPFFAKIIHALENLRRSFSVIHVHANNHCPMALIGGVPFPEVLEVTLVNTSRYSLQSTDEVFPTPLDEPNDPDTPDYFLGRFDWPQMATTQDADTIIALPSSQLAK
jgi:hypothetical protein